ncbi:hypothetical protein [Campylobacter californiensis]|uniref:hypothetical protein n=1 Tax=Campylobacter californiensis TaxID=1032243 RepID=UPI00147420C3|nr:hypothetical protein [Campylobacter sp. RM12916]MBE3610536.1 hypothetical protein [Campylobacter sp. RM12916]
MSEDELKQIESVVRKVVREEQRANLPPVIQGDKGAAEILRIEPSAMKMRRRNGFYREGKDFYKKGGIIFYDTDALLNSERIHNGN